MNSSLPFHTLLMAILAGGLVLPMPRTSAASSTQTVRPVDGEGIFLDALADEGAVVSLPHFRLADAPRAGQTVTLSGSQILEAARKAGVDVPTNRWSETDRFQFIRRSRVLGEKELKELLTASLQQEYVQEKGDLELRCMRIWPAVTIPDEPLTVKILELPTMGVTPNFIVRFELHTARETLGTWQMPLQAHVWKEIWVARSPLKRGQSLSEADKAKERRDLLALREAYWAGADDEAALDLVENVPTGGPIYARAVRPRPVVHRGQMVEAVVLDGALSISLKVEVLEEGAPSQTVRVRNPQSRREFLGKVQNEQQILVIL